MSGIIESEVVKLEDTGARPDYLTENELLMLSLKNPQDYVQVLVEEEKHTILVSKYRLGSDEKVKKTAARFLNLELENTAIEQSSSKGYIGNMAPFQAFDLNRTLGNFTLSPKYFLDFLKTLKSGEAKDGLNQEIDEEELSRIYDEITKVRESRHGEWLDAKFTKKNEDLYISHPKIINNRVEIVDEVLDNETLMMEGPFGISLEDLLENSTDQGLPKINIFRGRLNYYCPAEGRIAIFGTGLDAAYLDPGGDAFNGVLGDYCEIRAAKFIK